MPEIGKLVESVHPSDASAHEKIFYFMAYFNLAIVLLIVLVVVLWKW